MEKQWMRPEEAAPIIGIQASRIRNLMRSDYINKTTRLPIGRAYPPEKGGKHWSYRIYKPLLAKHIGLASWPEEWG